MDKTELIRQIEELMPKTNQSWDIAYKSKIFYGLRDLTALITQKPSLQEMIDDAKTLLMSISEEINKLDIEYQPDITIVDAISALEQLEAEL